MYYPLLGAALLGACGGLDRAVVPEDTDTLPAPPDPCEAEPEGMVALPADDGIHDEDVEWWAWFGHLEADDGRWFGVQQVFYVTRALGGVGQLAHAAITDVDGRSFGHDVATGVGEPQLPATGFDLAVGQQQASGGDGRDHLTSQVGSSGFDLTLTSSRPAVLQHEDGYNAFGFGGYTYSYSRQRMRADGELALAGQQVPVSGELWFDHQWGALGPLIDRGWDGFSLHLDTGDEIRLSTRRADDGGALLGGTFTSADCRTSAIDPGDIALATLQTWTSPHTGCTYPQGWTLDLYGVHYEITPLVADQELADATPTYWEGAAEVGGDRTGRAYVELNGYCP